MIASLSSLCLCLLTISTVFAIDIHKTETGDAQVTVKGVLGQSVTLPCNIDQDNCGEVYFITWTKYEKDDRWSRIYLFADNVEKPLRDLAGRARFSIRRNEAALVISDLKSGDDSLYKCDVTYVAGKCPSLTFVQLSIIAKPSRAYVEYQNSHIESESHIKALEGDRLRLTCLVIGGRPLPVVRWQRIDSNGKRKIIQTKNSTINGNVTSLELNTVLERDDLNAKYECHIEHDAINESEAQSFNPSVRLDLSVGPASIEIVGPDGDIKEGNVVIMQCIVYGSRPEVKITWRNGTQVIDANVRGEIEKNFDSTVVTRSFIELSVSRFDHLATFSCEAINPAMKQSLVKSIELRVEYAPIVVMEPQNGLYVNESFEMVNIYCTFSCNPPELIENATTWFKDGKELQLLNDSSHLISHHAGYPILTIVNPNRNDTGSYHCSISNKIGRGVPDVGLRLTVLYSLSVNLQIYPSPSQGLIIKEGDDVRMICEIEDGEPLSAIKYKWLKDGEIVSETSEKEVVWLNVDRNLSGNYTCKALNDAGWSSDSNEILIDVNYLPSKAYVRQLNGMFGAKGDNLTLECVVPEFGKPSATQFLWEHDDVPLENQRGSMLTIVGITLSSRGNISCAAVNQIGIGAKGYFQLEPVAAPSLIDGLPPTSGTSFNASHYSVSCRVECFPICNVTWRKNGEVIDNSEDFQIKNSIHPEESLLNRFVSVVSTLIWNMSAQAPLDRLFDSDVTYSCVSSDNIAGPAVESHTQFFVEYPPENLRLKPKRVDVIEHEIPPEIVCESDARPPATYRWQSTSFWDKFVDVETIADTQVLLLNSSIERQRSGTYTCFATNRHGESRIDLLINVLYAPTCAITESRSGKDDQNVVVVCEVTSANPLSDLRFAWYLNNETLNDTLTTELIIQEEATKSKVIIPAANDHLFGTWSCSVQNSVGESPNCTLFVSAPLANDWTQLNDESILVITAIIIALIILFIVILLILLCFMKRLRHKHESNQVTQTRENPDGSRSPTPSSVTSQLPPSQVITYKKAELNSKLKRNDKIIDANEKSRSARRSASSNCPDDGKEAYENMPFHRKKGMILSPAFMHQYENIAQLTREFRRTQSARCYPNQVKNTVVSGSNIFQVCDRTLVYADLQLTPTHNAQYNNTHRINKKLVAQRSHHNRCDYAPFGIDMDDLLYADMYDDVKSGKIPDPRIKPPLPPKGGQKKPPKLPPKSKK